MYIYIFFFSFTHYKYNFLKAGFASVLNSSEPTKEAGEVGPIFQNEGEGEAMATDQESSDLQVSLSYMSGLLLKMELG